MLDAFQDCVGQDLFQAQVKLLSHLGSRLKDQRLAVLVAALLLLARDKGPEPGAAGEITELLTRVAARPSLLVEETQESELAFELVVLICQEAGLEPFAEQEDQEGLAELVLAEFLAMAAG
jgi:hypothetical protein